MYDFLSNVIAPWFGFPGVTVSILLVLIGAWRKDWRWAIASVFTILPFTIYLMGASDFRLLAVIFPLLQGLAAWFIRRNKRWWAILPQAPLILLMLGLLYALWKWQG
ncbi:MAG TPA: hypothetical protein VNK49_06915 [Anaerolineales bacterium]|nr:hypothetical protein [Anaerolineales bacterium]